MRIGNIVGCPCLVRYAATWWSPPVWWGEAPARPRRLSNVHDECGPCIGPNRDTRRAVAHRVPPLRVVLVAAKNRPIAVPSWPLRLGGSVAPAVSGPRTHHRPCGSSFGRSGASPHQPLALPGSDDKDQNFCTVFKPFPRLFMSTRPSFLARCGLVLAVLLAGLSTSWADQQRTTNLWWMPENASEGGVYIDQLIWFILFLTGGVFVLTQIVYIFFIIKYRARKGVPATYSHGNNRLEIIWTAIPTAIFIGLWGYSNHVWWDVLHSTPPANSLQVGRCRLPVRLFFSISRSRRQTR